MNKHTGRKVNGRSALPPEADVALTLLAGETPCIICAEPIRMPSTTLCKECAEAYAKRWGNQYNKDRANFEAYRSYEGRPEWFKRVLMWGAPLNWTSPLASPWWEEKPLGGRKPRQKACDSK